MKILCVHSSYNKDQNHRSAVDLWRISRPMEELAKHVDWQIDHQETFIKGIEEYKDAKEFTSFEMNQAFNHLKQYDIIFSSYHADPTAYAMLKVLADKSGTQFIMDVDDDMFSVNPDNPFWVKMTDESCYQMQCMIRDNTWISTTNERLAKVFRDRRKHPKESVFVNPNYITDIYKQVPFKNNDIVIGYFGGSSHYSDLHDTGVAEALQKIMHENKNVRFKAVGMPMDSYLPRKRYEFVDGKRGDGWIKEIYPNLHMDIAIAPLAENIFNNGKSNIKWQEATRAGAVLVCSNFGPYADLSDDICKKVDNNSESWYMALKSLLNASERKKTLLAANKELENYKLENNWVKYKIMFEKVKEYKDASRAK